MSRWKNVKNHIKAHKVRYVVVCAVIGCFALYNLWWFGWRYARYHEYTEGLEPLIENQSYVYADEEGCLYNVKLPGYLLYAGNMCVAFDNQEQETTDQTKVENTALLIWPNMFSGYEYGLQTVINDEHYNIMLKEDLTAEDAQFDDIVNQKKDMLENLYGRAMEMWGIE